MRKDELRFTPYWTIEPDFKVYSPPPPTTRQSVKDYGEEYPFPKSGARTVLAATAGCFIFWGCTLWWFWEALK